MELKAFPKKMWQGTSGPGTVSIPVKQVTISLMRNEEYKTSLDVSHGGTVRQNLLAGAKSPTKTLL